MTGQSISVASQKCSILNCTEIYKLLEQIMHKNGWHDIVAAPITGIIKIHKVQTIQQYSLHYLCIITANTVLYLNQFFSLNAPDRREWMELNTRVSVWIGVCVERYPWTCVHVRALDASVAMVSHTHWPIAAISFVFSLLCLFSYILFPRACPDFCLYTRISPFFAINYLHRRLFFDFFVASSSLGFWHFFFFCSLHCQGAVGTYLS